MVLHAAYGRVSIAETNHNIEEVDDRTGEVLRRWRPEYNAAQPSRMRTLSGFSRRQGLPVRRVIFRRYSVFYAWVSCFPSELTPTIVPPASLGESARPTPQGSIPRCPGGSPSPNVKRRPNSARS